MPKDPSSKRPTCTGNKVPATVTVPIQDPWEASEIKILATFAESGQIDALRKQLALEEINKYRATLDKPSRSMDSLKSKLFRGLGTSDGSTLLPGPDIEVMNKTLQSSLDSGKGELDTVLEKSVIVLLHRKSYGIFQPFFTLIYLRIQNMKLLKWCNFGDFESKINALWNASISPTFMFWILRYMSVKKGWKMPYDFLWLYMPKDLSLKRATKEKMGAAIPIQEPWDSDEMRIIAEHFQGANCMYRGTKMSDGSPLLPGPDVDVLHQAFHESFVKSTTELKSVTKQLRFLKNRENLRKSKNELLSKRQSYLERRLKEDEEGKKELAKISYEEDIFCASFDGDNGGELNLLLGTESS
ncbi:MAG: hypothetical protein J3Q66DRAFT_444778 [Benniella sp.]|nr:MAG: hypothetical protein J3Q66DRAFT_444778 [Benniella sp.]